MRKSDEIEAYEEDDCLVIRIPLRDLNRRGKDRETDTGDPEDDDLEDEDEADENDADDADDWD